jgi:hypothetical protein
VFTKFRTDVTSIQYTINSQLQIHHMAIYNKFKGC